MFLFNVPPPAVSEDKTQVLGMPGKYSTTDYIPAPIPLLFFFLNVFIELYLYPLLTLKIPGQGVQYIDIKKTPIFIMKITNLGMHPAKGLSCGTYLFTWELSVRSLGMSEPDYTDA